MLLSFVLVENKDAAKHLLDPVSSSKFPRGESLSAWREFSKNGLSEGKKLLRIGETLKTC